MGCHCGFEQIVTSQKHVKLSKHRQHKHGATLRYNDVIIVGRALHHSFAAAAHVLATCC